jgi:hypothetical protein
MNAPDELARLHGENTVLATLLRQALEVVRTVEAEGSSEAEQLQQLLDLGDRALDARDARSIAQIREKLRDEYASGLDSPPR